MIVALRVRALGVLPLPERRLPAAAGRRHRQDVERRPGRAVPHLRPSARTRSSPTTPGAAGSARGRPSSRAGRSLRFAVEGVAPAASCGCRARRHRGDRPRIARSIFPLAIARDRPGRARSWSDRGRPRRARAASARTGRGRRRHLAGRPLHRLARRPGIATHRDCWERGVMAHTSPVYVALRRALRGLRPRRGRSTCSRWSTGSLTYIRERARSYRQPVSYRTASTTTPRTSSDRSTKRPRRSTRCSTRTGSRISQFGSVRLRALVTT